MGSEVRPLTGLRGVAALYVVTYHFTQGMAGGTAVATALQHGYLAVAGVLASLYPASTVLLAALVLRERVHRAQGLGLGLCAVAVALVAGG